jgi:hypothetical protein
MTNPHVLLAAEAARCKQHDLIRAAAGIPLPKRPARWIRLGRRNGSDPAGVPFSDRP